jgi:hypothetical protein
MAGLLVRLTCATTVALIFSLAAHAQAGANQFDPRDFTGIWRMTAGGGTTAGLGGTRPPMTPKAQEILDSHIPSRSDDRITVTNPALSNYPTYQCNPDGFPNLLFDQEPFEMLHLGDRILQMFQWEHRIRVLWTDGREVPSGENLENLGPAWYGHSVGVWEGDTFVVTTVGTDDRAWLDRRGHPKSFHAKFVERYRRTGPDTIELEMTMSDPENYTATWVGNKKTFTREPEDSYTYFGWKGLFSGITEGICAPMNEVEGFNKRFRDPAAFGVEK